MLCHEEPIPFCENPSTKTAPFEVPIGFLTRDAEGCPLYEQSGKLLTALVPSKNTSPCWTAGAF